MGWAARGQQPRKVDDAALKNAGKTGEEWLTYGLDAGRDPLQSVETDRCHQRRPAWAGLDLRIGRGRRQPGSDAAVLERHDLQHHQLEHRLRGRRAHRQRKVAMGSGSEPGKVQPKVCCGIVNRGIAIYEGKIIAPVIDGRLVALNAKRASRCGKRACLYPGQLHAHHGSAHRQRKGDHRRGRRGISGARLFRSASTPRPASSPGVSTPSRAILPSLSRTKTCARPPQHGIRKAEEGRRRQGLGCDLLRPGRRPVLLRYRQRRSMVRGCPRTGQGQDNLYAASMLAVKPDTGELMWHFQMVPGDEWDYDSVQQLMLADMTIKGQQRKVIMQANKDGFYYVIDRISGKFISGQPFAQVNWANGLNEETGRPIINPEAYYRAQPILISPSNAGAHNWAPMSFNPAPGLVYVPATISGTRAFASNSNFTYQQNQMNTGLAGGRGAPAAAAASQPLPPLPSPPAIGPVAPEGARIRRFGGLGYREPEGTLAGASRRRKRRRYGRYRRKFGYSGGARRAADGLHRR